MCYKSELEISMIKGNQFVVGDIIYETEYIDGSNRQSERSLLIWVAERKDRNGLNCVFAT